MNRIDLPPLREHREDIPALISATLAEFNDKNGTALKCHPALVTQLQILPFPGNIRELKNLVWQIASESGLQEGELTVHTVPPELRQAIFAPAHSPLAHAAPLVHTSPRVYAGEAESAKAHQWRTFCEQYHGDVYAMAKALRVHRTTIIRQLKKYGVSYARKPRASRTLLTLPAPNRS